MTAATQGTLTFAEYLDVCAQTEPYYELVRGELRRMNPPSGLHFRIAKFLERQFDQEIQRLNLPWEAFREIGQRTGQTTSRLPDVAVVLQSEFEQLLHQTAVLQVPSLLLVEIVSRSSFTEDYQAKLSEYQALGIPEYWVVDPESEPNLRVTIYTLKAGTYQKQEFRDDQPLISTTFPDLSLTATQVLTAKL